MARLRLAIATALALGAVTACAPGAHAARGMEVALQDDPAFLYRALPEGVSFDQAIAYAKALHVTWIRVNVVWSRALPLSQARSRRVPKRLRYQWGPWDKLVNDATANGIHVEMVLMGFAPAWATGNHKVGGYKPSAKQFGRFVAAAARHFYPRVKRFSIWNEPNFIGWLTPKSKAPALYRGLYLAAYKSLRRYARKAQVLMGETAPYVDRKRFIAPMAFLRAVTCVDKHYRHRSRKCPKLVADGYATHPYSYNHSPTYRKVNRDDVTIGTLSHLTSGLDRLRKLGALRPAHGRSMPVYLTEFAYLAKRTERQRAWPERTRARYLPQAFGIAQRNSRVRQMLQYELFHPPCPSGWCFWQSGLITQKRKLLASYASLQRWANGAAKKRLIATR